MAKQPEQYVDRYHDIFPTTLRNILEKHPKDGHSTTYKTLGEAVGVRQQTISQYASGQTQPTADVLLRIAKYFDVSVDYLLTGVSSANITYNEEFGLSERAIELLKKARSYCPDPFAYPCKTIPYLDELLSDKDFYAFLDELAETVESLKTFENSPYEYNEMYKALDLESYFIWRLQMLVQEFAINEIKKLGPKIELI